MSRRKHGILAGRPAIIPAITFDAKMPQEQEGAHMRYYTSRLYVVR